jgi:hypothetical protein
VGFSNVIIVFKGCANMKKRTLEYMVSKFATVYTTYNIYPIRRMLAKDFNYTSMWVFEEIKTKRAYLKYLKGKLKTIKNREGAGAAVSVDLVYDTHSNAPYLLLAQGTTEALLVFREGNGKLKRADLCAVNFYSYSYQRKEESGN